MRLVKCLALLSGRQMMRGCTDHGVYRFKMNTHEYTQYTTHVHKSLRSGTILETKGRYRWWNSFEIDSICIYDKRQQNRPFWTLYIHDDTLLLNTACCTQWLAHRGSLVDESAFQRDVGDAYPQL